MKDTLKSDGKMMIYYKEFTGTSSRPVFDDFV